MTTACLVAECRGRFHELFGGGPGERSVQGVGVRQQQHVGAAVDACEAGPRTAVAFFKRCAYAAAFDQAAEGLPSHRYPL